MAASSLRQCRSCERRYEVLDCHGLLKDGGLVGLDRDDGDTTCPGCGADDYDLLVGVGTGILLGGEGGQGRFYPRFDRGLGCTVNSEAHRRQLCKERNLVPVDGDFDLVSNFSELENERAAARARLQAEEDFLEHSSDKGAVEFRRLRSRGWLDDQLAEQRRLAGGG